tara:strand:+ start:263 stop:385 length:123 start_codon:yes stop_codon:yes gene_type:complete
MINSMLGCFADADRIVKRMSKRDPTGTLRISKDWWKTDMG